MYDIDGRAFCLFIIMKRLPLLLSLAAAAACFAGAQLPLPVVPATLTQPVDRAIYIIDHFWDGLDFADTTMSRDTRLIEQSFADYTSLFSVVADSTARLQSAVDRLVAASEADSTAAAGLREIAEIYLYDVVSPMHNDEYYRLYLNSFLKSERLDEGARMRYEYQLEEINKNRVGETAADFGLVAKDGSETTLSREVVGAPLTVVMFYNPFCSECHDISAAMAADPAIAAAVASGRLKFVGVIADGAWSDFGTALPLDGPIKEFAAKDNCVEDEQIYSIRVIPTLYILDSEMKVVMRDVKPTRISALAAEGQ